MEKINIAELLKDCPQGMELDCTLYDNCTFEEIEDVGYIYIVINTPSGKIRLTKEGCYFRHDENAKCVIFPKDRTTWEGFHRPFKDGDVISDGFFDTICIFKGEGRIKGTVDFYCGISGTDELFIKDVKDQDEHFGEIYEYKFATKEEKEKLFQVIKDNGYKWNAETKTLDKLIVPKFKVGDRIKHIVGREEFATIISVEKLHYNLDSKVGTSSFSISLQHEWELVSNNFDINSLVPFESKVLVRDSNVEKWRPATWGYYDVDSEYNYPYEVVGGHGFSMCIPYEGNSHLMGNTDDCDEFYKTW